MTEDLSKKTLAVLVFLIILVTVLGTWAVISQEQGTRTIVRSPSQAKGVVLLEIAGEPPQPISVTGNLALAIAD